jgi:hypothetical protein
MNGLTGEPNWHEGFCECGCGETPGPGKRFIRGHQLRVRENRQRTACSSHCSAGDIRAFGLWDQSAGLTTDHLDAEPTSLKLDEVGLIDPGSALTALLGKSWPRTRWGVIGLDDAEVVDFLVWKTSDGTFIGLDVYSGENQPGRRLTMRRQLTRVEMSTYQIGLEPSSDLGGFDAVDSRGDLPFGFDPVLVVHGRCDQHFTGTSAFDAHLQRVEGGEYGYGLRHVSPDLVRIKHENGTESRLEVAVKNGVCTLATPEQMDVVVWRMPLPQTD